MQTKPPARNCNAGVGHVTDISELKQVTFLTTRTSTGSKINVFHQSQPLTQSSDVAHAVRVVKNVTCLSSLLEILRRQRDDFRTATRRRRPKQLLLQINGSKVNLSNIINRMNLIKS